MWLWPCECASPSGLRGSDPSVFHPMLPLPGEDVSALYLQAWMWPALLGTAQWWDGVWVCCCSGTGELGISDAFICCPPSPVEVEMDGQSWAVLASQGYVRKRSGVSPMKATVGWAGRGW